MENLQFERICRYLRLQKQLGDQYDQYIARAGKRVDLSKPETDVLLFLANNPQYNTARDVSANRALSKTYVSKAVERLVLRGLLATEASAADRRLQFLRLTPAAAAKVLALRQAQADFFRHLTVGFSPENLMLLDRLLQQLQGNLDRL